MVQVKQSDTWEAEELVDAASRTVLEERNGAPQYLNFSNQATRSNPRFVPAIGSIRLRHNGIRFRFTRQKESFMGLDGYSALKDQEYIRISCHGTSAGKSSLVNEGAFILINGQEPIENLLRQATSLYHHHSHQLTTIYRPRTKRFDWNMWEVASRRPARPLQTVILDPETKEKVLDDINDYLQPAAFDWYASRGIPLRRGYLFHGPPGTGKTSFAFGIAGVFGLDLYVINLKEVTQEDLHALFARLARRCIVLLEDIDSAGLQRTCDPGEAPGSSSEQKRKRGGAYEQVSHTSIVATDDITLSGFLNAIDGVASHEGHVLIMTTNKPEALDEALVRPGRVDVQVAFTNASSSQASDLFRRTYDITNPQGFKGYQGCVDPSTLASMVGDFGRLIPDGIFSPAEIQGFLLERRKDPALALTDVPTWVNLMMKQKGKGIKAGGTVDMPGKTTIGLGSSRQSMRSSGVGKDGKDWTQATTRVTQPATLSPRPLYSLFGWARNEA